MRIQADNNAKMLNKPFEQNPLGSGPLQYIRLQVVLLQ